MEVREKSEVLTDLVCIECFEYGPPSLFGNSYVLKTKEGPRQVLYHRRAPFELNVYDDVQAGKNIKVTILRKRSDDSGFFPNKFEFEHVQDCGWSNNINRPLRADGTGEQLIAFFQDAFLVQHENGDLYVFSCTDYIVDKIEVVEEENKD